MDSSTRTRIKRAKILSTITEFRAARALNKKDRIDRNIFAGNFVRFNGVIINPVVCCPTIDPPLINPDIHVFCQAESCHRHQ